MTTKRTVFRPWHEKALALQATGLSAKAIYDQLYLEFSPITYDAVQGYLRRNTLTNDAELAATNSSSSIVDPKTKGTVEYKNGETTFEKIIELKDGEPVTPEIMMRAHNLASEQWEVVSYKNNFWQAQNKDSKLVTLYQSKLTVKPRKSSVPTMEEIKAHFDAFKSNYKPVLKRDKVSPNADKMLEINIADLHFGKLAWAPESSEHYDYKIARRRFNSIIDQEIAKTKKGELEKILFVWSNDFFNADGISDATTGGTPQDNDLRWQKMFLIGVEMLVDAITKLSVIAPVETFLIASNHSHQVEFYAINYLYAWFKNDSRVRVNVNCRTRYYYQYGINLIGFSHSSFESKKTLPHLMSVEAPEMWARSKYREFHLAHYHCELTEEKGGVIYRYLPSVTGPDAWHESSGFLGAIQRSYSFLWDKKKGLKAIYVDYPE